MTVTITAEDLARLRELAIMDEFNSATALALLDRLEAAERDAARYRWLRETGAIKGVIEWVELGCAPHDLPAMDTAIDAAIATQGESNG